MFIRLLVGSILLVSCGYEVPLDQCIEGGTKCRKAEVVRGEKGDTGSQGPQGNTGVPGQSGPQGATGNPGPTGPAGSSCSATQTSNGAIISCTDGTTVAILNGTNGTDGQAGADGQDAPPTAYSVVEMRDPCGKQGSFDEILLRTASGAWIAHFSSGNNQFLTILTPGTYRTTDSTNCYFTVNLDGTITGEHN